jgi:UDP-3-O-[3-hydroxymyristoyl] glucosamine N-acyltransferase
MKENKYEMTADSMVNDDGVDLYRIRALKSFTPLAGNALEVKAGDLGGYIESERNLSQTGSAWVADNAQVFDCARVVGDALVKDRACVSGHSLVKDKACALNDTRMYDHSQICEQAKIFDSAILSDYVKMFSHAKVGGRVLVCGNIQIGGGGGSVEHYELPIKKARQ